MSTIQQSLTESVTKKLDLLEVEIRSQAEEITQLQIKVELQRKQLNEANVQIKFLLQAHQCSSDEGLDRKCPLNEMGIREETVQQPESAEVFIILLLHRIKNNLLMHSLIISELIERKV